jgi:hypothetical protein
MQSRATIRQKLFRRQNTFSEADIDRHIHQGELQQFLVEISSEGHQESSKKMVKRMGYKIKEVSANEHGVFESD